MSLGHHYCRRKNGLEYVYIVARLWEWSKDIPASSVQIDSFDLSSKVWFHGQCPSIKQLIKHYEKVLAADLSFPIILNDEGGIMDGFHRVMKAVLQGEKFISAKRFPINPVADEIRIYPNRSEPFKGALQERVDNLRIALHYEIDRWRLALAQAHSLELARELVEQISQVLEELVEKIRTILYPLSHSVLGSEREVRSAINALGDLRIQLLYEDQLIIVTYSDSELGIPTQFSLLIHQAINDLEQLTAPML